MYHNSVHHIRLYHNRRWVNISHQTYYYWPGFGYLDSWNVRVYHNIWEILLWRSNHYVSLGIPDTSPQVWICITGETHFAPQNATQRFLWNHKWPSCQPEETPKHQLYIFKILIQTSILLAPRVTGNDFQRLISEWDLTRLKAKWKLWRSDNKLTNANQPKAAEVEKYWNCWIPERMWPGKDARHSFLKLLSDYLSPWTLGPLRCVSL